ncbi:MAG: phosphatidate cytidylyltransferase [Treponema sp.]|nr:phosphatidate cytidylyltransferase [Treponema sp.]
MEFASKIDMGRAMTLLQLFYKNRFQALVWNQIGADSLKSEIIRKMLHFLIALTPVLASFNKIATVALLMIGTLGYTLMEYLRISGVKVPIISAITSMASRPRDAGRFVIGPVTLGLGALLALLLYPSAAAAIAIYALAFGDGIASLAGRIFGKWRPDFLFGKSIEGSIACFTVVFACAFAVSGNVHIAAAAAFTAMVIEALPLEDFDNIAIPVSVGLIVHIVSVTII